MDAQERLPTEAPAAATTGAALLSAGGFYIEPVTPPESIFDAVDVEVAADGRIFVLMKGGWLRVVLPDGTLLAEPWHQFGEEVFNHAERGLLGFALHPGFPEVPYIYFVHTVDDSPLPRSASQSRAYGRVVRYTTSDEDPNRADPESAYIVLGEDFHDGIPSCYQYHSIGTIAFGHDGSLFVGSGDGDGYPVEGPPGIDTGGYYDECFSDDPEEGVHPSQDIGAFRSLSVESLAGKILRINPETGEGYPSNPFYTGDPTDTASKVWATGLRNPFRFSVVPAGPGETGPGALLIGDVGQSKWEELNLARGGENFGWPCFEGPLPYAPGQGVTGPLACSEPRDGALTPPYAYWHHDDPALSSPAGDVAHSITGGVVYPGTAYPEAYQGAVFFADYARQWVRAGRMGDDGLEGVSLVAEDAGFLVDLAYEPATGALLAADVINNQLVRIRYAGGAGSPPVARLSASALTAEAPARITFSAADSFDPDGGALTYEWTFGDGMTASDPVVEHTYEEIGVYSVTVRVVDEDGEESRASRSIRVGQTAPVVAIESPASYVTPQNGLVTLRATATDPFGFDGSLVYEWSVDLIHNDHEHQRFFQADGPEATFVLEPHATEGETSHYRATISVTDGEGLVTRVSRTLREDDPDEIDVAPAAQIRQVGRGVEAAFPRPIALGRVGIPGLADMPDSLAVEIRQAGVWRPARFQSVLPEPEGAQILFVEAQADAVRVVGTDTLAVYARLDPEAGLSGGGEAIDIGEPAVSGRAGSDRDGRLVLVGGGAVEQGAFHMVRQVLSGDGLGTVRLDTLAAGTPQAEAGIALRVSTAADAVGAVLAGTADGALVLTVQRASGEIERDVVGGWRGPLWLRLQRVGGRVIALASDDGESWDVLASRGMTLPGNLLAGPAVAGGDTDQSGAIALGWFSEVDVREGGESPLPEPGAFTIREVSPNPSRSQARAVVDAGREGAYRAELVDVLGRVVWRGVDVQVELRRVVFPLPVGTLSAGTYVFRVVHEESGDTRSRPITVVR